MKNRKPFIDKKTGNFRKVGTFGVPVAFFNALFHRKTAYELFRYLGNAISRFFVPQFAVKFKMRKIPVVHVDHELDYKVPFCPLRIRIYLNFLNLWISPLSFILRRVGAKKAIPYCARMIKMVDECYLWAYEMYRFRMTTTNRPMSKVPRKVAGNFHMIRTWDPHYMCVPSLHIAIVVLTYSYFRTVFKEIGLTEEEQKSYNEELYKNAVEIAETVLYVKQHSVNCIPAAVYMMRCSSSEFFSEEDAQIFINDLFARPNLDFEENVSDFDGEKIREHIRFLYAQFSQEGEKVKRGELSAEGCEYVLGKKDTLIGDFDWSMPLRKWILTYKAYNPEN